MSTTTFDAIDMVMLALIGVLTPIIFLGGIGWAYRMEQRGSPRKKTNARHHKEAARTRAGNTDRRPG